jgi:Tol biopolymer transport system component
VPSAAGGRVAVPGIASTNGFPHTWSPSGDRVAWISSDQLSVTIVATGATTSIASDTGYAGAGLAWSPDGNRILFGTGREIHTIEPSGANRRIIVQDESGGGSIVNLVATDWSPDSAAIVYGRNVYEMQRYREYHRGPWSYDMVLVDADVYRAAADGSATQNLTSGTDSTPIAWR